jgi:hypothetical protein
LLYQGRVHIEQRHLWGRRHFQLVSRSFEADRSFGASIHYQPPSIEPNEDEQLNPCETVYIKSQKDLCKEKFLDVAIDDDIHDQNRTEEDDQEVDEEGDDTESEDSDSDDTSVDDFENVEETHWEDV